MGPMLPLWMLHAALAAPDVDQPLRTGATAPNDSAVVIGIEDYFRLPDVPFARADAHAFRDLLVYTIGVPADRVTLLDDAPSREQLESALRDAGARTGQGGTVWVYFAGHGAASPQSGARVLLGADVQTDLATFDARAISIEEVSRLVGSGGAQVNLVLDTCYSGAGRGGVELLEGKRFAVPAYAATSGPKVLEWSATGPDQWSGPLPEGGHGAFTWAVLGALRGWADGERDGARDGRVSAEEARLYVERALREVGVRDQQPVLLGPSDRLMSTATEPAPSLSAMRRAGGASAPAAADAPPPTYRLDGFQLGDLYTTVQARRPWNDPCDNDDIGADPRFFVFYTPDDCGKSSKPFPDRTAAALFARRTVGEDEFYATIETVAWVGPYFDHRSDLPVDTTAHESACVEAFGPPVDRFALRKSRDDELLELSVVRYAGDIYCLVDDHRVVGFVLGPMPEDHADEQWDDAVMELYDEVNGLPGGRRKARD